MQNHLTSSRETIPLMNSNGTPEGSTPDPISQDLLNAVLPFSTLIHCASGEAIISQGDTDAAFYYIKEGMLEVSFSEGETRIVVALIGRGNFIGEIGFFDQLSRVREARTVGNTVVMRFDQKTMDRLFTENPISYSRFIIYLTRTICWKFRRAIEDREPVKGYAAALAGGKQASEPLKPLPDNFFFTREGKETSKFVENFKAAMFDLSYRLQADREEEPPEELRKMGFSVLDNFKAMLEEVSNNEIDPDIKPYVWGYIFKEIFPYFMRSRFAERVYYKPRGYAGDYLMIDMIYRNRPAGDGKLGALVDAWALSAKAPEAVRGRRVLLADQLETLSGSINGKDHPLRIMNLACGPCREIVDFLVKYQEYRSMRFLLVDIDTDALQYADTQLKAFSQKAEFKFVNENIIKWALGRSRQDFGPQDIIYSSGLTDYLEDRLFIKLVDRCHERLAAGGVFLVGNFGPRNPDRAFMDHILEWHLIYRSEENLKELFSKTLFKDQIEILKEPLGVNLFVKATKQ